jgi:signal peptidase I
MLGLAVCLGATAILAAAALGVGLVRRRLAVVEVAGRSMEPVLSSGDRVLVRRARLSELRPGLVAVVEMPRLDADGPELPPGWPPRHREWLIKRVAALPGDRLPAGVPSPGPDPDHHGVVPPGMFVVLGDNAMWSYDSRMIGCVPAARRHDPSAERQPGPGTSPTRSARAFRIGAHPTALTARRRGLLAYPDPLRAR